MTAADPRLQTFAEALAHEYRADGLLESVRIVTPPELSHGDVCVQLHVSDRSLYEVRVLVEANEIQAGFATEDRNVNEEIEQAILDSGDSLDELIGDELDELGEEPVSTRHVFERPRFRYCATLPLPDLAALEDETTRRRVRHTLKAFRILCQPYVDEG